MPSYERVGTSRAVNTCPASTSLQILATACVAPALAKWGDIGSQELTQVGLLDEVDGKPASDGLALKPFARRSVRRHSAACIRRSRGRRCDPWRLNVVATLDTKGRLTS